ncbi:MAG: Gldg family protein [Treponema sp.]|nr:Gldg family protein [Treponema sp.]
MKKFFNWLKSPSSDFALFIILLILANFVGINSYRRIDLTRTKAYSLSNASKQIVKNLEEPLSIRVFFDKNLPSIYQSTAQYVEDLMVEYKNAANKNFSVSYMDMTKVENQNIARDFGLRQIQIQELKNNEVGLKQVYMGLVITYGDTVEKIDAITSAKGFEYKVTSTISKMINTADTLASLKDDEKINVTLYISDELKALGISGAEEAETYIQNAVNELNLQKKNRLVFKTVHPTAEEVLPLVEAYGLEKLEYRTRNEVKPATIGLILEYNDNFRLLPVGFQRSFFGYAIAGLEEVSDLINAGIENLLSHPTEIGYLTGHNEFELTSEQANVFNQLLSERYKVIDLDLTEDDIPAGISTLIINGIQIDMTEEELYKIDQFVMKGGNLLVFADGLVEMGKGGSQYYNMPQYLANDINLDRLLEKYGVTRGKNYVMDKNCASQNNQQYGKLNYNWIPILEKNQLNQKHPISKNLGNMVMYLNSSLDISAAQADKDLNVTVLAKSSKDSWTMAENIMLNPMMINPPADPSLLSEQNLVVLLEGKFKSAFDAEPLPENAEDEETPPENPDMSASNYISASKVPGKVLISSTSYLTTSSLIDANYQYAATIFVMNLVDYLNGNADLCEMRNKDLSIETLDLSKPYSTALSNVFKYFSVFGLAILFGLIGLVVLVRRAKRKIAINAKYNPDDSRQIVKEKKVKKSLSAKEKSDESEGGQN